MRVLGNTLCTIYMPETGKQSGLGLILNVTLHMVNRIFKNIIPLVLFQRYAILIATQWTGKPSSY